MIAAVCHREIYSTSKWIDKVDKSRMLLRWQSISWE